MSCWDGFPGVMKGCDALSATHGNEVRAKLSNSMTAESVEGASLGGGHV